MLIVIGSVSAKRGRKSGDVADSLNQPSIHSYFKAAVQPETTIRYKVLREETSGITVGHLRRLARLGGTIPLGEVAFNTLRCDVCNSGDHDESIILCDKCNKGFHLYCLKPILPSVPSGEWYCSSCAENRKKSYYRHLAKYQQSQSLIVDFFKLTRPIPSPSRYNFRGSTKPSKGFISSSSVETASLMTSQPSPAGKGRGQLKCYVPSSDPEKMKLQHVALASAMSQQNISFSYELVYRDGCSKSMNNADLDEQRKLMKEMSKSDRAVYDATIKMSKEGFMVPVIVREDDIQGYIL